MNRCVLFPVQFTDMWRAPSPVKYKDRGHRDSLSLCPVNVGRRVSGGVVEQ